MRRDNVVAMVREETAREGDGEEAALVMLVAALCRREQQALDALYERTVQTVWSVAVALLGPADAEEVVEDVYLYVWRNPERYQPARGTVGAWLTTLCRSRSVDRWRALKRQTRLAESLQAQQQVDQGAVAASASPGGSVLRCDGAPELLSDSRLALALATLSPPQQQVIALAYFRGFTHQEISEHLSMKLGTAKAHLRRAIERLRAELTP